MSKYYPRHKAYRNCGLHNRTLAEIAEDPTLRRGAIIETDGVAHVPNVFGAFSYGGHTYHTVLTLVGMDDPYKENILVRPSRGMFLLDRKQFAQNRTLLEFYIWMDRRYCHEEIFSALAAAPERRFEFAVSLCERTEIFAMEFLGCYTTYLETILKMYSDNTIDTGRYYVANGSGHPSKKDVIDLICSFEDIATELQAFEKSEKIKLDSLQTFLNHHAVEALRPKLAPYYNQWVTKLRVSPKIVEQRTMEFIAMRFLKVGHPH